MMITIPLKAILPQDLSTISLSKNDGLLFIASKFTPADTKAMRQAGCATAIDIQADLLQQIQEVVREILAAEVTTWRIVSSPEHSALASAMYVALQEILNCSTTIPACHQCYDREAYHSFIKAHTKLTQH